MDPLLMSSMKYRVGIQQKELCIQTAYQRQVGYIGELKGQWKGPCLGPGSSVQKNMYLIPKMAGELQSKRKWRRDPVQRGWGLREWRE